MNSEFQNTFNALFRAWRASDPDCSKAIICYPGAIADARVEGVSVEFFPDSGDPWFGTFQNGDLSPNSVSYSGAHPNRTHAVVVSKGEGYIVNVFNPPEWEEIPIRPIMGVLVDELAGVMIAWDFVRMICLDRTGVRWKTPSISWDGIKDVSLAEGCVQATIWDAAASKEIVAKVAIADGKILGGAASPELIGIR